jgi:hypothetical protein
MKSGVFEPNPVYEIVDVLGELIIRKVGARIYPSLIQPFNYFTTSENVNMRNWMHSRAFLALIERDKGHQSHVQAYWTYQFSLIPGPPIVSKEIIQSNNTNRNWYNDGFVSPTESRYPTIQEDPFL